MVIKANSSDSLGLLTPLRSWVGASSDLFPDLEIAAVTEDSGKQLCLVTLLPHIFNALLITHGAQCGRNLLSQSQESRPEQAPCSEIVGQGARQTGHRQNERSSLA